MPETTLTSESLKWAVSDQHTEADSATAVLKRCQHGDQKAQMQLYQQYFKAMYNTSLRIVQDSFEAEDIMQEAFVAAFASLDALDDASKFAGWLKRIVVNRSINRLQQRKTYLDFVDQYEPETDNETTPEAEYSIEDIKQAMTALPEGYRVVLTLYLFEGYDHEEISEILPISSATSRSQYNRGKKRLIQYLQQQP